MLIDRMRTREKGARRTEPGDGQEPDPLLHALMVHFEEAGYRDEYIESQMRPSRPDRQHLPPGLRELCVDWSRRPGPPERRTNDAVVRERRPEARDAPPHGRPTSPLARVCVALVVMLMCVALVVMLGLILAFAHHVLT